LPYGGVLSPRINQQFNGLVIYLSHCGYKA
jgi:hypothetical protein